MTSCLVTTATKQMSPDFEKKSPPHTSLGGISSLAFTTFFRGANLNVHHCY